VAALAAGLAVALTATLLIAAVAAVGGHGISKPTSAMLIVGTYVQDFAFVAAALGFARTRARVRPRHFGLRATPFRRAAGWAVLLAVAFLVFTALWTQLLDIHQKDNLPSDLGADKSHVALAFVVVLVAVVAPICEEALFRGLFFTALWRWRGPWAGALLTGLAFGAIHAGSAPAPYLVPLGVLGFLLCVLRWRTGSLYPCIAVHATNNAVAFGVGQGGWSALGVLALVAGANLAVFAIVWPFRDRTATPLTA
jgi:membrane protease YdiL (CAAX protease family)